MSFNFADGPSESAPGSAAAVLQATQLNNEALIAERNGDLSNAERLHLRALNIKINGRVGDVGVALTQNALGELYLKMGNLDKAEEFLKKAVDVRNNQGNAFDAAVSRENLAQVYEARNDLKEALQTRMVGWPDKLACGNYNCTGQTFGHQKLRRCSRCKCVFYCSDGCQVADWKLRHKSLCKTMDM